MRSNNKKGEILQAALRVVEDEGANHLTIDAVAKAAGMSKGGVLYHFASKKELLLGLIDQLIVAHEQRVAHELESKNANAFAASLHLDQPMTAAEQRTSLAVLAAAAEDPDLIASARDYMSTMTSNALREVDPSRVDDALLLILANEGLRYLEILGLNPLTRAQTNSVVTHMSQMAEDL